MIGASTGGPRALEIVLSGLPANFPWPVLVAQHMPAAFTRAFADRLNQCCALEVVEAGSALAVEAGKVYIGRGWSGYAAGKPGRQADRTAIAGEPGVPVAPVGRITGPIGAANITIRSGLTAVLLTGMGHDGSDAFTEIKKRGGHTIAESEDSAVVYGMPAELVRKGGASLVLAVEKIAAQLSIWAGTVGEKRWHSSNGKPLKLPRPDSRSISRAAKNSRLHWRTPTPQPADTPRATSYPAHMPHRNC